MVLSMDGPPLLNTNIDGVEPATSMLAIGDIAEGDRRRRSYKQPLDAKQKKAKAAKSPKAKTPKKRPRGRRSYVRMMDDDDDDDKDEEHDDDKQVQEAGDEGDEEDEKEPEQEHDDEMRGGDHEQEIQDEEADARKGGGKGKAKPKAKAKSNPEGNGGKGGRRDQSKNKKFWDIYNDLPTSLQKHVDGLSRADQTTFIHSGIQREGHRLRVDEAAMFALKAKREDKQRGEEFMTGYSLEEMGSSTTPPQPKF